MSTQANLPSDPPGTSSLAGTPRGTLEQDAAATCSDLLHFIDESPTPFHAAASAAARLAAAGFRELHAEASWRDLQPGGHYLLSGDGTLVAFVLPERRGSGVRGFRIVGAHTDSPNLRLKPRAVYEKHGYVQLGVEVYGSPLLNSWLDRDLQLAGRVVVREADGRLVRRLVRLPRPLLRVAQLAIHLDREVNEKGLLLNRQEHLPPLLGLADGKAERLSGRLIELCAQALAIDAESIVNTELMLHDSQPSTRAGLNDELIFAPRLDNLGSSHAALSALVRASRNLDDAAGVVPLVALFDHEEIGSSTAYGAGSPLLPHILERIVLSAGSPDSDGGREAYHRALAGSLVASADMAHAVHPNYPDRHEVNHRPVLNGGPVIKMNANQRYATCGRTSALFTELCRRAKVPVQNYSHRTDLACGSTIGPITSTLLAVPTVDVGSPMLSMHSVRELAGAEDPELMARVLSRFLLCPDTV